MTKEEIEKLQSDLAANTAALAAAEKASAEKDALIAGLEKSAGAKSVKAAEYPKLKVKGKMYVVTIPVCYDPELGREITVADMEADETLAVGLIEKGYGGLVPEGEYQASVARQKVAVKASNKAEKK